MYTGDQVGYEAVESSCDQVTPDSNQDKPLSVMRYKELQQIAMSLNLPGNLKHKMLVDVIKARRCHREKDVERILAEHRCNRRPTPRRPRISKSSGCGNASGVEDGTEFSQQDTGIVSMLDASASSEDLCGTTKDQRSQHRGAPLVMDEGAVEPVGGSSSHAGPTEAAYVPPSAIYPYRYAVQPIASNPLNKSILASVLSSRVPSSSNQLINQLKYKTNDAYSLGPSVQIVNSPSSFPQTEVEGYGHVITPQFQSNFATPANHAELPRTDQNYFSVHQQPQVPREGSYGHSYMMPHASPYAGVTPQHNVDLEGSAYPLSSVAANYLSTGGSASNQVAYQLNGDSSNEGISRFVRKEVTPREYEQKQPGDQRVGDSHYSSNDVDGGGSPAGKVWGNTNVSSTSAAAQQDFKYSSSYGNNNSIWHYQGVPLNYNGTPMSPSNVAHDLTMPSRRTVQDDFYFVSAIKSYNANQNIRGDIANQSLMRPPPYPQSRCEVSNTLNPVPCKNSMTRASDKASDGVTLMEEKQMKEMAPHPEQHVQQGEKKDDHPSSIRPSQDNGNGETYLTSESTEPGNDETVQHGDLQHNISEPTENGHENTVSAHRSGDPSMTSWSSIYPCFKPNQNFPNQNGLGNFCSALYGQMSSTNTLSMTPCSGCDLVRYSFKPPGHQALMNFNASYPSSIQSNQFNAPEINYGSQYNQELSPSIQNFYYSQFSGPEKAGDFDMNNSPDESADGYLQENDRSENCPYSYTPQSSMESMWSSSARASSPELDNPLVTPSPKDDELGRPQNSCVGETIFPDGTDLEIEDDQSLSFPNLYDYVMSSADGESCMDVQGGGKVPSESGDSLSPGKLCVVEEEEEMKSFEQGTFPRDKALNASSHDTETSSSTSAHELNSTKSSTSKESSSSASPTDSLLDKSVEDDDQLDEEKIKPVAMLKRKRRQIRDKNSKIQRVFSRHCRKPGFKSFSPSGHHGGGRSRGISGRDLVACPHERRKCEWIGRIPALASHIRLVHGDTVVSANDSTFTVHMKELNKSKHLTYFQESSGMLYLIAVHWKDCMLLTTIQSLPGSGRNGPPPSGTKASLEVLLKNGNSHGWRGRVWGLVAPHSVDQKSSPHSPASLQERLWSRGDYLCIDPANMLDSVSDGFRLYVSITTPDASAVSPTCDEDSKSIFQTSSPSAPDLNSGTCSSESNQIDSVDDSSLPGFNESFNSTTSHPSCVDESAAAVPEASRPMEKAELTSGNDLRSVPLDTRGLVEEEGKKEGGGVEVD